MTRIDDAGAVLNELLGLEQEAIVPRLFESTVFVSQLSLEDWDWARRAARSNHEHRAHLTDLIVRLGGEPSPRRGSIASADLHYQELHTVQPRIEENLARLVRAYRAASARLGGVPEVAPLLARILKEHESELAALTASHGDAPAAAAG